MITKMTDVAREAGVSQATVSLALSKKGKHTLASDTVGRIRKIADQMGYRPNRMALALKNKKTHMIGVLQWGFVQRNTTEKMDGVSKILQPDYSCVTAVHKSRGELERIHLRSFIETRLDGVIASWTGEKASIDVFQQLHCRYKIPLILFDRPIPSLGVPVVRTDYFGMSYKPVEQLTRLGHKKILFASLGGNVSTDLLCAEGYTSAMRDLKLEDYIRIIKPSFSLIDESNEDLRRHARDVVAQIKNELHEYTAVLAQGDFLAYRILEACHHQGIKIPMEISLIGQGDFYPSDLNMINLSTVSECLEEIGTKAAELLLQSVDGKKVEPCEYVMPVHVHLRGTTGQVRR